jgi:NADPH:quinone reductase-like Zn-dependent oxidoreductase
MFSTKLERRIISLTGVQDLYALKGRVDTRDSVCSSEFTGIVVSVGSLVCDLVPGDPVVGMGPGHLSNYERVPYWACCKLRPNESFEVCYMMLVLILAKLHCQMMCTLPVVFSTAIYALRQRANLQKGEVCIKLSIIKDFTYFVFRRF